MLYKIILVLITTYLPLINAKEISPELQKCMTQALLTTHHTSQSLDAKRIGQGDSAIQKEFRSLMDHSTAAPYNKHIKAKTVEEAKQMSKGKDGVAQYIPGIDREHLERSALLHKDGFYHHFGDSEGGGKHGVFYKFVKFEKTIGYDNGKETQWLRVEWSSGQYHGHPVNTDHLRLECGECLK